MGVCTTNRRVAGASAHWRSFLAAPIRKASRDRSTPAASRERRRVLGEAHRVVGAVVDGCLYDEPPGRGRLRALALVSRSADQEGEPGSLDTRGEPVANGVEQFPCLGRGDVALVAAFELGDPHGVGLDGALQAGVRDLELGHGLEQPRHLRLKLRYALSGRDRAVALRQQAGGEAQRQHHEPAKQAAPEMRSFPVSTISQRHRPLSLFTRGARYILAASRVRPGFRIPAGGPTETSVSCAAGPRRRPRG